MAQENLIKASPIPYTIVRATQFFEFVGGIAQIATEGQTVRLPRVLMQPIAADDVAAGMADLLPASALWARQASATAEWACRPLRGWSASLRSQSRRV